MICIRLRKLPGIQKLLVLEAKTAKVHSTPSSVTQNNRTRRSVLVFKHRQLNNQDRYTLNNGWISVIFKLNSTRYDGSRHPPLKTEQKKLISLESTECRTCAEDLTLD